MPAPILSTRRAASQAYWDFDRREMGLSPLSINQVPGSGGEGGGRGPHIGQDTL